MKLGELGEFRFIDRIAGGCLVAGADHVVVGVGDDAAVLRGDGELLLVTTDLLVERVHFLRGVIDPLDLGYKALAVNLSDIAAMGGSPRDAWISIAVPPAVEVEELDRIYDGMKGLARSSGVNLLGGDTTGCRRDLCLNLTVLGTVPPEQLLLRSGARPGQRILVTGTLGDSAAGLEVILRRPELPDVVAERLLAAHHRPATYLEEARLVAASGTAGAAIDLSDGLASDLGHVCTASGVVAVVDEAALPLSEDLRRLARAIGADPLRLALSGG